MATEELQKSKATACNCVENPTNNEYFLINAHQVYAIGTSYEQAPLSPHLYNASVSRGE